MSDLTINTSNPAAVGGLSNGGAAAPAGQPAAKSPADSPVQADLVSDSITLSGAAQNAAADDEPQPLSDNDAQDRATQLRQQLGSITLSGTARQNQAIVALLR